MQKTYKRDHTTGKFATRTILSRRARIEDRNGKIVAGVIVASIAVCLALGAYQVSIYTISSAKSFWGHVVSQQVELSSRALDIAYANILIAEASEPLPYVTAPDIVPPHLRADFTNYSEKYGVPPVKMARIIAAESSWRENAKNYNKKSKTTDHGFCQQNDFYWKKKVEKAGLKFGSLEACFWVYTQAGEGAWKASEKKWNY